MRNIMYVGIGGFIGASLRYIISISLHKLFGTLLPYGTLMVNALGGILMGYIMGLSMNTNLISPALRLFLTTGILGGFTTFSAFSYETVILFSQGSYLLSMVNIVLNLFLGLLGAAAGMMISKMMFI